ncbi:hypothetical protein G6F62_002937 [Rhizopus arrhizus]|nr:hypothetical protein G6F23_000334 [Rhizopus arrhizus]KAG0766848.1 hypothetical protein G6F24_003277 [Rhizopus arrhizus]KAG0793554.1 hypothetical protein G6F21_003531 [Rhizopus arrhizus]KAG0800623.1 hypothetical protein G6F22_002047 [Rhizopus arrhizus]KAG0814699.1 hypothetical protein G6F20_004562 [Rhizopus arrhizus]
MDDITLKRVTPNLITKSPQQMNSQFSASYQATDLKNTVKSENLSCSENAPLQTDKNSTLRVSNSSPSPIFVDTVPLAGTFYQTRECEKFLLECNPNVVDVRTTLSHFVHPLIAKPLETAIGNISETEVLKSAKLIFIKDFLKKVKAFDINKKHIVEIAFICNNRLSEIVLRQMIKGRGYKTTFLERRGFKETAHGIVVCCSNFERDQQQIELPNYGQTLSIIIVVDIGATTKKTLSKISASPLHHRIKMVDLFCIDTPESRLQEYSSLYPNAITPYDRLYKLYPSVYEYVFGRPSRHNSDHDVMLWNTKVATHLCQWLFDNFNNTYQFDWCSRDPWIIEFYFSYTPPSLSPANPKRPISCERQSEPVNLRNTRYSAAYTHPVSENNQRALRRPYQEKRTHLPDPSENFKKRIKKEPNEENQLAPIPSRDPRLRKQPVLKQFNVRQEEIRREEANNVETLHVEKGQENLQEEAIWMAGFGMSEGRRAQFMVASLGCEEIRREEALKEKKLQEKIHAEAREAKVRLEKIRQEELKHMERIKEEIRQEEIRRAREELRREEKRLEEEKREEIKYEEVNPVAIMHTEVNMEFSKTPNSMTTAKTETEEEDEYSQAIKKALEQFEEEIQKLMK